MTKKTALFFLLLILTAGKGLTQPLLEIWQIQGAAAVSPYDGQTVRTSGNIVTLVTFDGFYMQSPPDRGDGDAATSDGVFVYTEIRPSLRAGDRVDVQGMVREREGLTSFDAGAVVTVTGTGVPLPPPLMLDAGFPGPAPRAVPRLESVEGMRVTFSGRASGPTNRFGECPVAPPGERPFREAGILWPGRPGLPVWDGNPEVFWFDTGPDDVLLASGTEIEATGVLSFTFGRYIVVPQTFRTNVATVVEPRPVRPRRADEYTVGSLNVLRLLAGEPGYETKLDKLAAYIVDFLGSPDVLALQELGGQRAIEDLAARIRRLEPAAAYATHFRPGPDDIHLGYLTGPRVSVEQVEPLAAGERLPSGGFVHDRPPLLLRARLGEGGPAVQVINVHMRSRIGIEAADSVAVRTKRHEQGLSLARLIEARRGGDLVVVGDFNAFPFSDGYVDVLSQVAGLPSLGALYPVQPLVSPPLFNHTDTLAPDQRYSFVFNGSAELIDHCLTNEWRGLRVSGLAFARGNADTPYLLADDAGTALRCSDHDGFVVFLTPDGVVDAPVRPRPPEVRLAYQNPVPEGGLIRVHSPVPLQLHLLTVDGRPVLFKQLPAGDTGFTLPAGLPAGSYVLSVMSAGGRLTRRLVVPVH